MTDAKSIRAKGATQYDLLGIGDEEFERMGGRLVRLEFPKAFKPANTKDGGADIVRAGGGYERGWQSKHFTGNIRWDQCEKSLAAALKNYPGLSEYTFVFPRELTNPEQKTFDKKFLGDDARVEVNYWNSEELQARLTGSDEGQRVARTFFDDVELDRENTYRAIEVGGRLETPEDALDRVGNIGGFLASKDAFFSYPASTHEADQPGHPMAPGSVMSVGETAGSITRRIDVVPRDEDVIERYGPEFVLDATEGEAGQHAAAKLEEALREGKAVEIGEGLDVTFTRMPPAFKDMVGKRLTGGTVQIGKPKRVRARVPPFKARIQAETDRGTAAVNVELRQVDDVPDGWDDAFVGHYGGMAVTQLARQIGNGGEVRWNFRHRRNRSPACEQLAALKFMTAFGGAGEFTFSRLGAPGPPAVREPTEPVSVNPDTRALIAFLEDVRTIEKWTGVEYELPESLSAEDARAVRQIAAIIRAGGASVTWHNFELVVDEAGLQPLRDGRNLRVEREASAAVLGRVVDLGYTRLDILGYTVVSVEPAPDLPGQFAVRLEPASEASAKVFEHLAKTATRSKSAALRPPPPPPRKRRRNRSSGGKKRKQ